jgi:hypothetical protein
MGGLNAPAFRRNKQTPVVELTGVRQAAGDGIGMGPEQSTSPSSCKSPSSSPLTASRLESESAVGRMNARGRHEYGRRCKQTGGSVSKGVMHMKNREVNTLRQKACMGAQNRTSQVAFAYRRCVRLRPPPAKRLPLNLSYRRKVKGGGGFRVDSGS